jgi:hypothetical protein
VNRPARLFLSALLLSSFAFTTGEAFAQSRSSGKKPELPKGLVLSETVHDALEAIGAKRLGGVFSYVGEKNLDVAFANLLMADHRALKRFMKFSSKRLKRNGSISIWEKKVMLLVVGMNDQQRLAPGTKRLSSKMMGSVSDLALAPASSGRGR